MVTRLRASPRHDGSGGGVWDFSGDRSAAGASLRGRRRSSFRGEKYASLIKSNENGLQTLFHFRFFRPIFRLIVSGVALTGWNPRSWISGRKPHEQNYCLHLGERTKWSIPASPDDWRCIYVERVGSHRQREEVGIMCLQVLHVPQPCQGQGDGRPVYIHGKVVIIGLGGDL